MRLSATWVENDIDAIKALDGCPQPFDISGQPPVESLIFLYNLIDGDEIRLNFSETIGGLLNPYHEQSKGSC
ncbi:MAG: hypothetical protein QOH96_1026 [Blastocatellia bacterium]|nr:hypothetical protein [Blastocatellia bacterium]